MNAKRRKDQTPSLVMLPLGGTGEIGMNCYCYGSGPERERQWLILGRLGLVAMWEARRNHFQATNL